MATLKELEQELEPYKNTLVLDGFKVVHLVGVKEDIEDFYWICYDGKMLYYLSCVMAWMPLKGKIETFEYNWLVNVWNLNHENKVI